MAQTQAPPQQTALAKVEPQQSSLTRVFYWEDIKGRQIEASVRLVQQALTPVGKTPFAPADCLKLILACKSRGWDMWGGDIQLVRYQEGGPASLVTNYFMFTAEAQKAGGSDYVPPEFEIEIDEKTGFPVRGRVKMRRASWPDKVYRYYPVDGGFISFDDLAPKVKDRKSGKERLRATWAAPGSARHMLAKTLEARITRLVWADATRGLYLREEMGTFRMPQDQTPEGAEEPDVLVDAADPDPDFAPPARPSCPKCGKTLVVRSGQNGEFLACPGYPKCKFSMDLPEEVEDAEEAAPAGAEEQPATQTEPQEPPADASPAPDTTPANPFAEEEQPQQQAPPDKQAQAEGFVGTLTDDEVKTNLADYMRDRFGEDTAAGFIWVSEVLGREVKTFRGLVVTDRRVLMVAHLLWAAEQK